MSKLEDLRKLVADAFKDAEDKTTIEKAAVINAKIDEVSAEEEDMLAKHKELLASYKDVVLHTSVKTDKAINTSPSGAVDLEGFLNQWTQNNAHKK